MILSNLPRSYPEKEGVRSSAILEFVTRADHEIHHLHSFMLVRHAAVIAEGWWHPYRPNIRHMLFSLSKSFTSTAIGLAIHEGRLSENDPVLFFFPEDAPKIVSKNLAAMQVRHLLAMSTGHDQDITEQVLLSSNPIKTFLALPVEHAPGTHFVYNTAASFMLSAILQKQTGQTLLQYLTPRLFEPLQIYDVSWDSHPVLGVNFGGFGMYLTTEEIALFGQLYLQKGCWNGQQLIPEAWVERATAFHTDNSINENPDWKQGYAYHFWRCQPAGVYRGDGACGQFLVIMPEQDAILAITGGLADMQQVLDLVWKFLLPEFINSNLPDEPSALRKLKHKLKSLAITPPQGIGVSKIEDQLSRKHWIFKPNPLSIHTCIIDFSSNTLYYDLQGSGELDGSHELQFGRSAWIEGKNRLGIDLHRTPIPQNALSRGTWIRDDSFELTICMIETPFILTLAFTYNENSVTVLYKANVRFGPTEFPPIQGIRKDA